MPGINDEPKSMRDNMLETFNCPLELQVPLVANGVDYTKLYWDPTKMTIAQYNQALRRSQTQARAAETIMENDYNLHLILGETMVMADERNTVDGKTLTYEDFSRIGVSDAIQVQALGRFFINQSVARAVASSETQPEATPDDSLPPSQTSEDSPSSSS